MALESQKPQTRYGWLRGTLAVLAALVALTTIQGAIFVVPTMPRMALHQGLLALFTDYTIPALVLGILWGGSVLLAFVLVLVRPRIGAMVSVVAGILMVGFELVEIVVVSFTPVLYPTQPVAWLQVLYLVVGSAMALLGGLLWKAENATN
jgi:hypothetical protein